MRSNQDIHNQVILYRLVKEAIFVDEMRWKDRVAWASALDKTVGALTPRLFDQVFPIEKTYDGQKWGCKDYFSVSKYIDEEIGWDEKTNGGFEFLLNYLNHDVNYAAVQAMTVISDWHKRQTGESVIERFARENGIPMYTIDSNGNKKRYEPNSILSED